MFKTKQQPKKLNRHTNLSLSLLLFVLLTTIYSITYSGTFIADDEHILSSRTLSLAFDEKINNNRVYGNSRLYSLSTLSPEYAASAINVEPGQAVIGYPLAHLAAFLKVGRIQTLFLLNIGVVAFTAVVLFGAARFLGYSKRTAFTVGILFGLGTMAWSYTKTYFRDPLAMMFLAIAWTGALVIGNQHKHTHTHPKYINILAWFALLAGITAGILTKNTITIALPSLAVYLIASRYTNLKNKNGSFVKILQSNWKKIILLITVTVLALIAWFIFLPPLGIFERFTFHYYKYLIIAFFTTPHPNFLEAVAGPLISPGKSIFIYSPILILSIWGIFKRWRIAWPSWVYLFSLIIGQALFYDDEWWGFINWGLRFIIPAIPPLIIAALPAIDSWLNTKKGRAALLTLGGFSILMQIIAILPPMRQYYVEMAKIDPSLLWSLSLWKPKHTALAWHINWLLDGGRLDLAVVRILPYAQTLPVVLGFFILGGLIILAVAHPPKGWLPYVYFVLNSGLVIAMLFTYANDPAYQASRNDLQAAQQEIAQNIVKGDIVIVNSYSSPAWYYWMNWAAPGVEWMSLPFHFPKPSLYEEFQATGNPEVAMNEATLALFQSLPTEYNRVWLVLPDDAPGSVLDIEAAWLKSISISSELWTFQGADVNTRVYLFELAHIE